jgi:hypothetical protein
MIIWKNPGTAEKGGLFGVKKKIYISLGISEEKCPAL